MERVLDLDDTAAALAALSGLRRARMAADRDIVTTAVHYADLRNGDTARTGTGPDGGAGPAGRGLPGMERPVRVGGAGTPLVAEFAAADGRLAWSRLFAVLEAAVIEADPDAAAEREHRAAAERFPGSAAPTSTATRPCMSGTMPRR